MHLLQGSSRYLSIFFGQDKKGASCFVWLISVIKFLKILLQAPNDIIIIIIILFFSFNILHLMLNFIQLANIKFDLHLKLKAEALVLFAKNLEVSWC